jgi:hypothetical protein
MRSTTTLASLLSLLMVLLLAFPGSVHAQLVTGDLQFSVVDSLGDPVPGVNAVVTGPNVQGARGGVTNDLGLCTVLSLSPGKIVVRLSHTAYQSMVFENVLIQLGKTTSLGKIRLLQRTVDMPEQLVSGQRLNIDPTTTTYGSNLRQSDFETLPIERTYRSISTLLPLVNQSYLGDDISFAGATGLENKYLIDGVDVTETYKGYTGTDLPYNFIKEISMIAGGYEAEYRSALGGILNVVTYSGGNEFSGEAFGFFTSNGLTGSPRQGPLDIGSGQFADYDFGFRLGGPLIRDRLWFLGSYNPKVESREVPIPDFGNYTDKSVSHIFAGKLTWKASEKVNVNFNVFGDPSEEDLVALGGIPLALGNPDPMLQKGIGGGINLALQGSFTPDDKFLVEWSLARTNRNLDYEAATERGKDDIQFVNNATDSLSGGTDGPTHLHSFGTTVGVTGTWISGSHTVKSGMAFKDIGTDRGRIQHALYRSDDTTYWENYREINCTVHNRIPSIFAQDSWLVNEKLRVNVGLRWDGQFLVGSDGYVHQKILDQIQPRIGIIFLPTGDGAQKFSLSFGRFYQELSTELASTYLVDEGAEYWILYNHDPRVSPSGGDTMYAHRNVILPEVRNLKGQYFDEWHVGYEQLISDHLRFGVQGIYRTLGEAIEDSFQSDGTPFFGNPGRGLFSQFPKAKRDYSALVVTLEGSRSERFNFLASYVISRNYGNYSGIFNSDYEFSAANVGRAFDQLQLLSNATGLLPNDRTHVFKFSCSYRFTPGLTGGISLSWQSGTPLNEFETTPDGYLSFMVPRGTFGRTPASWDLNLRLGYDLPFMSIADFKGRLILDVFHILSQRKPVDIDQGHYNVDPNGNLIPNTTYGFGTRYQAPMSMRLGMELSF